MIHTLAWINLKVMLSLRQTKNTFCIVPFIQSSRKENYNDKKQINGDLRMGVVELRNPMEVGITNRHEETFGRMRICFLC